MSSQSKRDCIITEITIESVIINLHICPGPRSQARDCKKNQGHARNCDKNQKVQTGGRSVKRQDNSG